MRRFLLTAILSLASLGAVSTAGSIGAAAAPGSTRAASGQAERMSRVQADFAQACRADCLQQAARPGAHPSAPHACHIRCGAGQAFSMQGGAMASGRGVQPVAQRVQAAPAQSHGVIFAARSPSAGFGLVVGESDRLAAFRTAEQRCNQAGPGCRILAEFTAACGAVAQGVRRHQSAIMMTSDASTFNVISTSAGTGDSREAAERDAMAECRSRDAHSTCRIVAVQCGRQG